MNWYVVVTDGIYRATQSIQDLPYYAVVSGPHWREDAERDAHNWNEDNNE